jgi:hypothetical protein
MLARVLTVRNLTCLMIAMPAALVLFVALCVGRYVGPPMRFELAALVVGLLIVVGSMFAGAGVLRSTSHGTKDQTAFALATLGEKTVWIGGAVFSLVVVGVFAYFTFYTSARWPSAFEPLAIWSLAIPPLAQISVGRRLGLDRAGANQA